MDTQRIWILYLHSKFNCEQPFQSSFEALWYCFSLWSVLIWKAHCLTQGLTARPPYLKANQPGNVQNIFCRFTVLGIEAPFVTPEEKQSTDWVELQWQAVHLCQLEWCCPYVWKWCARNGGVPKIVGFPPQIIHFKIEFSIKYKPSILGETPPIFWKHPNHHRNLPQTDLSPALSRELLRSVDDRAHKPVAPVHLVLPPLVVRVQQVAWSPAS